MFIGFLGGQIQRRDIACHEFQGCFGALGNIDAQIDGHTQKPLMHVLFGAAVGQAEDHHRICIVAVEIRFSMEGVSYIASMVMCDCSIEILHVGV